MAWPLAPTGRTTRPERQQSYGRDGLEYLSADWSTPFDLALLPDVVVICGGEGRSARCLGQQLHREGACRGLNLDSRCSVNLHESKELVWVWAYLQRC